MPYLIVFSHLRWSFVYQRPQHLMSRLAQHYRILFFEEPTFDHGRPRIETISQGPNIDVLCPHTPVRAVGFHDDQLSVLKPLLTDYLSRNGIDDYVVWFYTPMPLPLIAQLHPRAVVYDCMDELTAFKDAPRQLYQRETALLKVANVVFADGPSLYESRRNLHPSAVDGPHFSPTRLQPDGDEARAAAGLQAGLRQPLLGYFGVIDERLDLGLIDAVAVAHPEWDLALVGPIAKIDPARVPQRPNIHWLGMQPYARLPYLMAAWDVCLLPFARNEATRFISPTKTLEYMAAASAGSRVAQKIAGAGKGAASRQVSHLIVGAGPTGLAAAYRLGQMAPHEETLVVEREDKVGGWCRSVEQHGFTFDYAGHIVFSTDRYVLDLYEKLLGDNVHWQNREAWIYSKNVYTRYPLQGSLYGLPPQVLKECLVGAIAARFGPLDGQGARAERKPENFEQFIHQVWGAGIARHFAIPYNEKLWAVPLAEMETSWLGGRVPLPDLEQTIAGALEPTPPPMGPNARFGYPLRGGFQALMNGFLPHLKCELALKTGVLHVSPSRRTVRLDDGRSVRFKTLLSTMPLPQLVEACGEEAPPPVRAAARALRHVSVRCVNLGIGREKLTDKHWIYYPEDTVFHRIFVQGNASPHCNAPGGFGLTCEISYSAAKPLPCDGTALIKRVIKDCRKVGMVRADDTVVAANQVDLPCAYVVYDPARAAPPLAGEESGENCRPC